MNAGLGSGFGFPGLGPESDPPRLEDERDGELEQSETQRPPIPPQKRRKLTDARRLQNRLAQRTFRQRRKEHRQQLKASAESSNDGVRKMPVLKSKPTPLTEAATESERDHSLAVANALDPTIVNLDTIRTGASELDSSAHPLTESSGDSVTSDADFTFPLMFPSPRIGHKSDNTTSLSSSRWWASDPLANTLEFKQSVILAAMLQNASALGFNLDDVGNCRYDVMSPLYSPATPASDPIALLSSFGRGRKNKLLPPDLRPTLNQILIPHHVSLDLIPFPALRDRLIVLSAAMPATFNMWELKLDIYERGGLTVVKGKRDPSGKGELQPWDRRSWVATPWFLRKWRVLVEDEREQLEGSN